VAAVTAAPAVSVMASSVFLFILAILVVVGER